MAGNSPQTGIKPLNVAVLGIVVTRLKDSPRNMAIFSTWG
jgi:hypothetical protein